MSGKSAESAPSAGEASSSYTILRVLKEMNSGPPPPGTKGYHPAAAVNLAAAHRWVTYDSFMCVLRGLTQVSFRHSVPYADVEAQLKQLFEENPAPFAADSRFPESEVYVCVDRAPVGSLVVRMREALALGLGGVREYFDAVRLAMDVVTGEEAATELPVLFNRSIFESVFQLQWTNLCSGCGAEIN
ncbi:uncharacterized protein [Elaeis guineensis]|uniref:Uncharacterized protein LOC105038854 isoform X3 n=1 Tax=Elaeis guineensis var. tenera TaxID=51953 RepID=A0A6J0PEG3_ELAGV|nr:uncharacterized protein LOC105038854 isoform X3 [Elaeis guineensis]